MENQEPLRAEYWRRQTALITGASRGIGRDLAIRLARLGCRVAINFKSNEKAAHETLTECLKKTVDGAKPAKIYQADVANEKAVEKMISAIQNDLGPISILVNNAGHTQDDLLVRMPSEAWHSVIETHLSGAFYCSRAVLKGMMAAKFGRIVNLSSISGIKGNAGQCNYSAAKAGLIGLTKALAKEVGNKGITCNAVALGLIETEMTRAYSEREPQRFQATVEAIPVRRMGTASEVSSCIEYLCGPEASYISGSVIQIDGGKV